MKKYQQPHTRVMVVNEAGPIASSLTVNDFKGNGAQLSKSHNWMDDDERPAIWK
jgi:hypothetical protein